LRAVAVVHLANEPVRRHSHGHAWRKDNARTVAAVLVYAIVESHTAAIRETESCDTYRDQPPITVDLHRADPYVLVSHGVLLLRLDARSVGVSADDPAVIPSHQQEHGSPIRRRTRSEHPTTRTSRALPRRCCLWPSQGKLANTATQVVAQYSGLALYSSGNQEGGGNTASRPTARTFIVDKIDARIHDLALVPAQLIAGEAAGLSHLVLKRVERAAGPAS